MGVTGLQLLQLAVEKPSSAPSGPFFSFQSGGVFSLLWRASTIEHLLKSVCGQGRELAKTQL